jgi:hypothetical protein
MFINGSPHAVTDLWDVAAHHLNLKFTCPRCGHSRVLHAATVWWRFQQMGWNGHLSQVAKRIMCGTCWEAAREKVRSPTMELVEAPDDDDPLPLPPAREWKRAGLRRR